MPHRTTFSAAGLFEIENDVFADAADPQDSSVFDNSGDFFGGGLKRLWLLAQPDGLDGVARHPLVQASGDSFHLRQFRHENPVYGIGTSRTFRAGVALTLPDL